MKQLEFCVHIMESWLNVLYLTSTFRASVTQRLTRLWKNSAIQTLITKECQS